MAIVLNGQCPNGMISNFEATALQLFTYDISTKRKTIGDKRDHASISESSAEVSSSSDLLKP